jgi:AraC-like DNA-binding protein
LPRAAVLAQAPGLEALLPAAASVEPEGREESAYRLAAAVLTALKGGVAEVPPSLRRSDRDRAHEVAAHIEAHHADELPLGALAAIAGMSPYHFLRLFQRELGLTPHQYLIRTRLRRAVALLRDTGRSVTDVALTVGYGDLSNFVRTFRKHVGCTPEAFRRAA